MAAINHRMFAQQDDLAVTGGERFLFCGRPVFRLFLLCFRYTLRLQFLDDLARLPGLDLARLDQAIDHDVENVRSRTGSDRDTARMQRHVALLDTFGAECTDRGEILREPDNGHQLGEFHRGFDVDQSLVQCHRRIRLQRTADDTDLQRQLDFSDEVALIILVPARQRGIATASRSPCMTACLDGAPVIAGSQRNGVDTVHHALVVRDRAVRVHRGEFVRDDDAIAHLFAIEATLREQLRRDDAFRTCQRTVGKIGKDAQEDLAAGDVLHQRGDAFAHGVHEVGSHRVTRVDQQVNHQHVALGVLARVNVNFKVLRTTPARHHFRVQRIGEVQDFFLALQDCGLRLGNMRNFDDLDLADEDRVGAAGFEAARIANRLRCGGQRSDNRRFFDRQRHDVILAVHQEIQAQPSRQAHHADDVLDHLVGGIDIEHRLAAGQGLVVVLGEQAALAHHADTVFHRHLVETGNSRTIHSACCLSCSVRRHVQPARPEPQRHCGVTG